MNAACRTLCTCSDGDVLLQASNHAQRSIFAVAKRGRVLHRVRQPHVRGIARLHAAEAWFGDADDLELTIFLGVVRTNQRPMIPGSPPNRCIQNAWLRTATGCAPGADRPASSAAGQPRGRRRAVRTRHRRRTARAPSPSLHSPRRMSRGACWGTPRRTGRPARVRRRAGARTPDR